jgi:hypothetical protein
MMVGYPWWADTAMLSCLVVVMVAVCGGKRPTP